MKNLRKIIAVVVIISLVSILVARPIFANVNEDFSSGEIGDWSGNGGQAISISSESNGNKYMQVKYNAPTGTPSYFDVWKDFPALYGSIVASFDVKFSETMKENIYLKCRTTGVNDSAARIYKNWKTVYYVCNNGAQEFLFSDDNLYNKWYTFTITLSTSNGGNQSIVVKERDTGMVVKSVNNVPLNIAVSYVNQFAFGSGGTMCLDNLKIYNQNIKTLTVTGESYPIIGKTYGYTAKAKEQSGLEFTVPIEWSLKEAKEGVTISSESGYLTITETADVGPVVIVATNKNNRNNKKYYLVDIEK